MSRMWWSREYFEGKEFFNATREIYLLFNLSVSKFSFTTGKIKSLNFFLEIRNDQIKLTLLAILFLIQKRLLSKCTFVSTHSTDVNMVKSRVMTQWINQKIKIWERLTSIDLLGSNKMIIDVIMQNNDEMNMDYFMQGVRQKFFLYR